MRALPISGGRSVSGPSYWPLNQIVPDASTSMWRIDSWCSSGASSCFSIRSPLSAVDEDEGRLHGRDVELGAAEIRMRLDAAIGDRQRAAVAEQQHFVRVHAVGRELADAAKAARRVVDADHAGGVVEIVLGGVEQRAVGREHAMAEEMPAGGLVMVSGSAAPVWSKTTAKVPGRRANTTERRAIGSKVTSWPRSGSGEVNSSLLSSDSTATPQAPSLIW